jgi:hypothetical protein
MCFSITAFALCNHLCNFESLHASRISVLAFPALIAPTVPSMLVSGYPFPSLTCLSIPVSAALIVPSALSRPGSLYL